jgi:hypothetical protein
VTASANEKQEAEFLVIIDRLTVSPLSRGLLSTVRLWQAKNRQTLTRALVFRESARDSRIVQYAATPESNILCSDQA